VFGEVNAAREILRHDVPWFGSAFMLVWITMWTIGGGVALWTWLWFTTGRERIRLRPDALVVRREVLGLGRAREFEITRVRHLRVVPLTPDPWNAAMRNRWGVGGGPIAFDYGAKTYAFGSGVDDAEARDLVARLMARHAFQAA
jgi:hypothetical protein